MKASTVISSLSFALASVSALKTRATPYIRYRTDNMNTCIWYSKAELEKISRKDILNKPKCLVTTEFAIRDDFEEAIYEGFIYRADLDRCTYDSSDKKQNCIPFKTYEECKSHCGGK